MTARPGRRGYLDWMRGLGVVIMVGWHTLDSWTLPADKATGTFWYFQLVGGFGAPIFLFLAGVSIALAAASRLRRNFAEVVPRSGRGRTEVGARSDPGRAEVGAGSERGRAKVAAGSEPDRAQAGSRSDLGAAWPMVKRGGWILVLALLFRLQSDVLGGRTSVYQLVTLDIIRGNTLKVDILNVMGPAISGAALLWGVSRARWRMPVLMAAAAAFAFATPAIRGSTSLAALPDALEGYLRPFAGRTTFSFFPWAGFVFAGAAVGALIDRAHDAVSERRLIVQLAIGGVALSILATVASHGPALAGESDFWRTAPSFFFIRVSVLIAGIAACYAWEARPRLLGADPFSPMRQFGVTSLFVYWIHVEMAYGGLSRPIRERLPLPWSIVAFLLFLAAMLGLSVLKTAIADRWKTQHQRPTA